VSLLLVAQRALIAPGWAKDALWRRARAVPSLDLRFADNKSLADAVTGRQLVTFTRASSGTFVDSAGVLQTAATDVPRFDHNPTTGESLGLLVEEARTNLLLNSNGFNTTWVNFNISSTAASGIAPDGTNTAWELKDTLDAVSTTHSVSQSVSATGGIAYSVSVFLKAGTLPRMALILSGTTSFSSGNKTAVFNLTTGAIASTSGTTATSQIIPYPNGWYRCTLTATADATAIATLTIRTENGTSTNYIGDGTGTILIWGAQLEAGAFRTSYIATAGATATRSASLADLISSAIANNIRSFYVEFSSPVVGTRGVVSLNDNTANERADLLTSGTDPRLVVHDGGAEQANINGGTVAAGVRTRVAVRISTNDFAISINGGAVVSDTSGTLPTVDRLMLGRTQAGEYLNGRIARFTGWAGLLPNSTLQSLAQ